MPCLCHLAGARLIIDIAFYEQYLCMCVFTPEAINYINVILILFYKLSKFHYVSKRKEAILIKRRGLSSEICHDKNQHNNNKTMLMLYESSIS